MTGVRALVQQLVEQDAVFAAVSASESFYSVSIPGFGQVAGVQFGSFPLEWRDARAGWKCHAVKLPLTSE